MSEKAAVRGEAPVVCPKCGAAEIVAVMVKSALVEVAIVGIFANLSYSSYEMGPAPDGWEEFDEETGSDRVYCNVCKAELDWDAIYDQAPKRARRTRAPSTNSETSHED